MKKSVFTLMIILVAVCSSISNTQAQRTGVYINNVELNYAQLQKVQPYSGILYAGFYYLDQYGNFGLMGYRPYINLIQQIQNNQKYRQQVSYAELTRPPISTNKKHTQLNKAPTPQRGHYYNTRLNKNGNGVLGDGTRDNSAFFYKGKYVPLPW